jgi:hypothetical protein
MAKYKNGTTTQAIKATGGTLLGVIVNSHTSGTLQFNDGAGGTSAGVKASGVFTSSDVFTEGETVTIGSTTYTFVEELSGATHEILIGASAAASLDNLKSAINASAGGGTTYGTGTPANPHVTATTNTDTAQTVEAHRVGTYANTIATTTTCADVAWGATTLESGAEASALVCNTITLTTGPQVLNFGEGIDCGAGIYLTKGGTIDYTVLYK